ncbi:MAG: hypothetical protein JST40_00965 [Armatimonadetes bacterium]|nr:hypothetical protein [Armatimonadota bacterium]
MRMELVFGFMVGAVFSSALAQGVELKGAVISTDFYPSAGAEPKDVLAFDLREFKGFPERCLAASVQGLYNSHASRGTKLYLIWSPQDESWLKYLVATKRVSLKKTITDFREMVKLAGVRRAVVFDRKPYQLGDIATTVAGCERALLVADPKLADNLDLEIKVDLRDRFESNVAAYAWLVEKYGKEFNRKAIAISPPGPTPAHVPAELRDYQVANRIFTFWLTGDQEKRLYGADRSGEERFLGQLLEKNWSPNIPCLGYPWSGEGHGPGEGPGVTFLSQRGKWLVPTDLFTNLSFWTCFKPSEKQIPVKAIKPKLEPGKKYAAVVMSDGDNLCTWLNFFPGYLDSKIKRDFPMSWTMGPTLRELAPPVYEWNLATMPAGDSIGTGVSGVGYIALDEYGKAYGDERKQVIQGFLDQTNEACGLSGMKWLWVMRYGPPSSDWINYYAWGSKGIKAIMGGYGKVTDDFGRALESINQVGIFHCLHDSNGPEPLRKEIDRMVADPKCPRFLHIFLLNWNYPVDSLPGIGSYLREKGIEPVTPEVLADLYQQSLGR